MGKPAVVVSVEKQPNVDTIALTREIEQALKEITASLPQGIKADQIVFRQANFIETSIRNVAAACCSRPASSSPSCCSRSC